jgi:hypothetical protein
MKGLPLLLCLTVVMGGAAAWLVATPRGAEGPRGEPESNQREVKAPAVVDQTMPTEVERESISPRETAATSPSPSPKPAGGVVAMTEEHRQVISRAVQVGALPNDGVALTTPAQWDELVQIWNATSADVIKASRARRAIGHRLAMQRLADGRHERFEAEESERLPGGGFTGPWAKQNHRDDLITNRSSYRPGGGQIIEHVRFAPGDAPEIDEATAQWRLMEALRRDAVARFVSAHSFRDQGDRR